MVPISAMKDDAPWFLRCPVPDPREALRRLAEHVQKFSLWRSEPVEVEVFLSAGPSFSGKVARIARERDDDYVLLTPGDDADPALVFVRLSDVSALRIQRASAASEALRPSPTPAEPAPTQLQIKRALEAVNQELKGKGLATVDCDWPGFGESPEERSGLQAAVAAAAASIRAIAGTTIGADAVKAISSVTLRSEPGARPRVARADGRVDITADVRRMPADFEETVRSGLESVL
jgi:hypothetical protein